MGAATHGWPPLKSVAVIALLLFAGCAKNSHHYTLKEIEAAVRSGKIDQGFAVHHPGDPAPSVHPVSVPALPLQLFALEDRGFTHTVLVDGWDLVLLYGGPSGSGPFDYHLEKQNSSWVLTFKYKVFLATGEHAMPGRYVLTNPPAE